MSSRFQGQHQVSIKFHTAIPATFAARNHSSSSPAAEARASGPPRSRWISSRPPAASRWSPAAPYSLPRGATPMFRVSKIGKRSGALLRSDDLSPGPCASSGGRLTEALFMVFLSDSEGAKACKSCRSRQDFSNEYLLFTTRCRRSPCYYIIY